MPEIRVLKAESEVGSLAFSKDGRSLATFSRDGDIRVWNIASGSVTQTFQRDKGAYRQPLASSRKARNGDVSILAVLNDR